MKIVEPLFGSESFHSVDLKGILEIQCTDLTEDGFLLAMNAFDMETSSSISSEKVPELEHLGNVVYFVQQFDGQITDIYLHPSEQKGPHLNLKLNLINSLQTYIESSTTTSNQIEKRKSSSTSSSSTSSSSSLLSKIQIHERDLFGLHRSTVETELNSDSSLKTIVRSWNHVDTIQQHYVAPKKIRNLMNRNLKSSHSIDSIGQMIYSFFEQILNSSVVNIESSLEMFKSFLYPMQAFFPLLNLEQLHQQQYLKSSLMSLATTTTSTETKNLKSSKSLAKLTTLSSTSSTSDPTTIATRISSTLEELKQTPFERIHYRRLSTLLRSLSKDASENSDEFIHQLSAHLESLSNPSNQLSNYLMSILARSSDEKVQRLFISQGLSSRHHHIQRKALLAAHNVPRASQELMAALAEMAFEVSVEASNDKKTKHDHHQRQFLKNNALLAFGSVLDRCADEQTKKDAAALLSHMLEKASQDEILDSESEHKVAILLHTVANAGPHVMKSVQLLAPFLSNDNSLRIQSAALRAVQKFPLSVSAPLLKSMSIKKRFASLQSAYKNNVKAAEKSQTELEFESEFDEVFTGEEAEDPFPRNESLTHRFTVGDDKVASLMFESEVFAGTNWHCDEDYFNYEVAAASGSYLNIMGFHEELLGAEALYGKMAGKPMEDQLAFTLKGKTILQQDLSTEAKQCHENINSLTKVIEPLFQESWSLWSLPVPVNLVFNADIVGGLGFGFDICDTKLGAKIDLRPEADTILQIGVEAEFAHFKMGLMTSAQAGAGLTPTTFVEFSKCDAGVELDREVEKTEFSVAATFDVRECIWAQHQWENCHWSQATESPLFDETIDGSSAVVEQKVWSIPKE